MHKLALDGSGNTTGAPAMDEQGDSTRQTTWRPFLTEPATLLHVVNGSRDPAVTLAPGYGAEGGSVGPLAINVPDAVDEAHWYVKPVASLPGHTPATSGGAGLPHAPLYVCSGFNRKHGTGDDRTTAPPDAYPLPAASAPGGGDPGSSDGESKASTGPCACSLGNPSVANVASTTDPGLGVMLPGYVDAIMASVLPVGPGGVQVLGDRDVTRYGDTHFDEKNGDVFFSIGSSTYRLRSKHSVPGKGYDVNPYNLVHVSGEDIYKNDASEWKSFFDKINKNTAAFGGSGGCKTDDSGLETLGTVLDIIGFVPALGDIADMANIVVSEANGDHVSAALGLIAAIPGVGSMIAVPIKWAWKTGRKIAWTQFYNLVEKVLNGQCIGKGLRGKIEDALKKMREQLNKTGLNLPEGWCFVAGTGVATDEGDKPIEEVEPGDRVLTPGTLADAESPTEVDPKTWLLATLEMDNPTCAWDTMRLRLLRPISWFISNGVNVGRTVEIDVAEFGLRGVARVIGIEICPHIKAGRGRVVTGTISHFNAFVRRIWFDGSREPLGTTNLHPFRSLDRDRWVHADELRRGERIASISGACAAERMEPVPGVLRVFNLEVEREHVYYVGEGRLLVHNGCFNGFDDLVAGGKVGNVKGGVVDGVPVDGHHLLPQGNGLRARFEGIEGVGNVDDWKVLLPTPFHQKIHRDGWNKDWESWFDGFGKKTPTMSDLKQQLDRMIKKYGIGDQVK